MAAGNSCKQTDVSACANLGRKAVADLLSACKAAAMKADNDADRARYGERGRERGREGERGRERRERERGNEE